MSGVTVTVGIGLVLHLDGRHRRTVGMAYHILPLMFERPLLRPTVNVRELPARIILVDVDLGAEEQLASGEGTCHTE